MEAEAVNVVGMANDVYNFSVWSLFLRADLIVKVVMIVLVGASIWCWAIIYDKVTQLKRLNRGATKFEDIFWSGGSLDALYEKIGGQPSDPMSAVFGAAMREWRRSSETGIIDTTGGSSLMERVGRVMDVTVNREVDRIERQMTVLASTGSTAPFIGLFGTVWGIMNSFQAISVTKNTSLAVVAPGIAEALFATALGLVAAIPAVVAYNYISKDLDRYAARLDDFATEFSAIISRQLEGKD
ncbi:MAG: protein TolQ [Rhodospirillales bacterium]|nr:protein TolQ [Rhodospirillales bacterium]